MKRKRKKEQLEEKSRDKNRINKKVDYAQGGIVNLLLLFLYKIVVNFLAPSA